MKIIFRILIVLNALALTSCSNWLDLTPEGQATDEKLFSTGDGYRTVLSGLYKDMSNKDLYGVELQFGFIDCISQQYTWNWDYDASGVYVDAYRFDYKSTNVRPLIDRIWLKGYNVIANANNLIQNVSKASDDIFANKATERRMILGEAYACRALMHFDLLRLFAPAPINDDGAKYLPYVDTYPNIQPDGIDVKTYLSKVIADLEQARELVADFDTTALGQGLCSTGEARFYSELSPSQTGGLPVNEVDNFLTGRGYRLNYYAITALLARVYQYADRHEDAFKMAKAVLDFKAKGVDGSEWEMFSRDEVYGFYMRNEPEDRTDVKMVSNLIFAIYCEKAYEDNNLGTYFQKTSDGLNKGEWFVFDLEGQEIFKNTDGQDELETDARKYLMFQADGNNISAKWYCYDNINTRNKTVRILPVIRATEMRYIIAEYYARNNQLAEAYGMLNEVRVNRQLPELKVGGNYAAFQKALVRDAQREWMSEGQLFYLYKRLNCDVKVGGKAARPLYRSEFMLPLPDNQSM